MPSLGSTDMLVTASIPQPFSGPNTMFTLRGWIPVKSGVKLVVWVIGFTKMCLETEITIWKKITNALLINTHIHTYMYMVWKLR